MNRIPAPSIPRRHRVRCKETGKWLLITPGGYTKEIKATNRRGLAPQAPQPQPYVFVAERFNATALTSDEARRYLKIWFHADSHEVTNK